MSPHIRIVCFLVRSDVFVGVLVVFTVSFRYFIIAVLSISLASRHFVTAGGSCSFLQKNSWTVLSSLLTRSLMMIHSLGSYDVCGFLNFCRYCLTGGGDRSVGMGHIGV